MLEPRSCQCHLHARRRIFLQRVGTNPFHKELDHRFGGRVPATQHLVISAASGRGREEGHLVAFQGGLDRARQGPASVKRISEREQLRSQDVLLGQRKEEVCISKPGVGRRRGRGRGCRRQGRREGTRKLGLRHKRHLCLHSTSCAVPFLSNSLALHSLCEKASSLLILLANCFLTRVRLHAFTFDLHSQ